MAITFRRATAQDLESILALNAKLFANDKQFDPSLDVGWIERQGRKEFEEILSSPRAFTEVAENEGKVVGYLSGSISEQDPIRTQELRAEADNMFVEEEYRGLGVGAQLINNFLAWCKEQGVQKVAAVASHGNERAIKLYKKLGFKEYTTALELDL